jgi:hypothetical protein
LPDRGRLGLRRADANFWWVDNLALDGQTDRATALFGRLLGHANDPGLLPEEVDPASGQLLGSFLQAFSYVGLIRAAINLQRGHRTHHRAASSRPIPPGLGIPMNKLVNRQPPNPAARPARRRPTGKQVGPSGGAPVADTVVGRNWRGLRP